MEDDSIAVSATCVRIPVLIAHQSQSTLKQKKWHHCEVKAAIAEFPGAVLKTMLLTKSTHKPLMRSDHVIPSLDGFVKT